MGGIGDSKKMLTSLLNEIKIEPKLDRFNSYQSGSRSFYLSESEYPKQLKKNELNSPPEKEGLINEILISDISQLIFSFLNAKDLQSVVLVCKQWNKQAIQAATQEIKLINEFQEFLIENLPNVKINIEKAENAPDFCNLKQVKSSILGFRKNILSILKDLKDEDLKNLEECSKKRISPKFFESIFDLAWIYKEIDKAVKMTEGVLKEMAFSKISTALSNKGEMEEAQKIVEMIPEGLNKEMAFLEISRALLNKGEIEEAKKMAEKISEVVYKEGAFLEISRALSNKGEIEEAIKIAVKISDDYKKSKAFLEISRALSNKGEIEEAKKMAEKISEEYEKSKAFLEISKVLVKKGEIDEAKKMAEMISKGYEKNEAFLEISRALSK